MIAFIRSQQIQFSKETDSDELAKSMGGLTLLSKLWKEMFDNSIQLGWAKLLFFLADIHFHGKATELGNQYLQSVISLFISNASGMAEYRRKEFIKNVAKEVDLFAVKYLPIGTYNSFAKGGLLQLQAHILSCVTYNQVDGSLKYRSFKDQCKCHLITKGL